MPAGVRTDEAGAPLSRGRLGDGLVLAPILLLALMLRLAFVDQPLVDVFSWREASTAMMADAFAGNRWNIFLPEVRWTGPGPGYQGREFQVLSYLAALANAAFGWHDWTGRMVAALFGTGTTFALHRLARRVWDEIHAHAAALAYAVMPAAVMIDSSFLPDPAMLALVTIGVWLLVAYSQEGGEGRLALGGAALTLGILAKLPGICALAPVAALLVALGRAGRRRAAGRMAAVLVVGLMAVASYYAWALHLGRTVPPYHTAGAGYVWQLGLAQVWAERFYLPRVWAIAQVWFYGWPFLVAIGLGLWVLPTPRALGRRAVFVRLPLWWLGAAAVFYLVAQKEVANNIWNLHIFHVPFAMLAGRGALVLTTLGAEERAGRSALRAGALMLGTLVFATLPLLAAMKAPVAEAGRRLGQEMAARAAPGDLVVAVAPTAGDPVAVYYAFRRGWVFPPGGGRRDWSVWWTDGPEALAALAEMRAKGARWFGYARLAHDGRGELFARHYPLLIDWLDRNALKAAETPDFVLYALPLP